MYLNPRLFTLLACLAISPAHAQVSVQEYAMPRGHGIDDVGADPAPNGPVYFSAQGSGHLGILDPNSGEVDRAGAPYLTDGGQNAIVRVDPKSRAVKV